MTRRAANLLWGTAAENHADTLRCDHILRGAAHPNSKQKVSHVEA